MGPASELAVKSLLVIAALACGCGGGPRAARTTPRDLEVLLNEQLATSSGLGALVVDFDVSPERLVLLSDAEHMYIVGWGGLAIVEGLAGADSFAYTRDGLLLVVRGNQLLYQGESGALEPFFDLPRAGMGLATGSLDSVYLFDRHSDDGNHGLYELSPGRKIAKLLDSPDPIDAVAEADGRLLFASSGVVFDATPSEPIRMVARLSGSPIRAVAVEGKRVYLSDGAAVYALSDEGLVLVSAAVGGTLRVRDGALLVLDPARRLLLRLDPI